MRYDKVTVYVNPLSRRQAIFRSKTKTMRLFSSSSRSILFGALLKPMDWFLVFTKVIDLDVLNQNQIYLEWSPKIKKRSKNVVWSWYLQHHNCYLTKRHVCKLMKLVHRLFLICPLFLYIKYNSCSYVNCRKGNSMLFFFRLSITQLRSLIPG